MPPIDIGSKRELMVDDHLIDRTEGGARLKLQHPIPREIVIRHDAPWEGCTSGYHTIWRESDTYRMVYRGSQANKEKPKEQPHAQVTCYAESGDGIHWQKPNLGLVEFEGSTDNNIIWEGHGSHNFAPVLDTNPDCPPDRKYKALGGHKGDLKAFHSADGLRWEITREEPVLTDGKFDSQNLAFYDAVRGEYRAYFRDNWNGVRGIYTATSPDFLNWTERSELNYGDAPVEHLYVNQIMPYYRAPHLFIGFPTRFCQDRGSVTEGLFMTSRDGTRFNRWGEALIRPGLNPARWGNRSNYIWWGVVETESDIPGAPNDLSIYSIEGYYEGEDNCVRRFTCRVDGFVSLNAPLAGGEMVTKPLAFDGSRLSLNVSTSAFGSLRVALLDEAGKEIEGFGMDDADEFFGDTLDHTVTWRGNADVSALAGKPVRLRIALSDADLFALRFVS